MDKSLFLINGCTLSCFSSTRFSCLLLLLFLVNSLFSQVLLEKGNRCILRSGIQVKRQIVCHNVNDELEGRDVLWDFSTWKLIDRNYTSKYFDTGLNSVSKYEHRTFYNYEFKNDTLFLCGYKNSTANVSYLLPEVSLVYPLKYGDSISSYFYGVGDYSNHVGLTVYGKKEICADALGTLVLPSGDTVSNVIRVHSEKVMQHQFTSGVFLELDSLPIPPIDSITNYLCKSSNLIKMDVFEWYVEGCCKPIFETIKNTLYKSGKPYKYFSTAFYCPIEDMENININNTGVRISEKDKKKFLANTQSEETFNINSFLDEGNRNITIEYNSIEGTAVEVMLFDIQGRLLFCDKFVEQNSGKYNLCVDVSKYAQMEFVVRISMNEKVYSEKFLIKY